MGLIVVGIDHSNEAKAALRFAFEEARLRRGKLRAVHAIDSFRAYPSLAGGSYSSVAVDVGADHKAAEELIESMIKDVEGDRDDVEIERHIVEGVPSAVLVEESRGADLLVVGSRGRGGFAGLLLGSVSQQCAHHAHCPVVIIRASSSGSE